MRTALDTIHVDEHVRRGFTARIQAKQYTDSKDGRTDEMFWIEKSFDTMQVMDYIHSVWGTERIYYRPSEDGLIEANRKVVLSNPVVVVMIETVGSDYRLHLKVGTDHRRSKITKWSDAVVMLGQVSTRATATDWMKSHNMQPTEAIAFMDYIRSACLGRHDPITQEVCIEETKRLRQENRKLSRENAALREQVRQLRQAPMPQREIPKVDITLDVSAGLSPRTLECLQESLLPMVRSIVLLHEGHDPEREPRVTCKINVP